MTAVLAAAPEAAAVAVNFEDATTLTGHSAGRDVAQRDAEGGRFVAAIGLPRGPAMYDTARLDAAGGLGASSAPSATLDEVLCCRVDSSP